MERATVNARIALAAAVATAAIVFSACGGTSSANAKSEANRACNELARSAGLSGQQTPSRREAVAQLDEAWHAAQRARERYPHLKMIIGDYRRAWPEARRGDGAAFLAAGKRAVEYCIHFQK